MIFGMAVAFMIFIKELRSGTTATAELDILEIFETILYIFFLKSLFFAFDTLIFQIIYLLFNQYHKN